MPENWRYIPHYVCRALVLSAVRSMRDLYPYPERWDVVRDLIDGEWEMPPLRRDVSPVAGWSKEQCWTVLIRGMMRGLFVDEKTEEGTYKLRVVLSGDAQRDDRVPALDAG